VGPSLVASAISDLFALLTLLTRLRSGGAGLIAPAWKLRRDGFSVLMRIA